MLRVTVEMVPGGIEDRAHVIGTMLIVNDGTGDRGTGNYDVQVFRAGQKVTARDARGRGRKPLRTGRVERYPRLSLPVWALVRRALDTMGYR